MKKHDFLRNRNRIREVYPGKVKKEHIEFLRSFGQSLMGIGLQSFDNEVLAHVERSYAEARFEQIMYDLKSVAAVAVEIIMGLPGDMPENFRKSFERADARDRVRVRHSHGRTRRRAQRPVFLDLPAARGGIIEGALPTG